MFLKCDLNKWRILKVFQWYLGIQKMSSVLSILTKCFSFRTDKSLQSYFTSCQEIFNSMSMIKMNFGFMGAKIINQGQTLSD